MDPGFQVRGCTYKNCAERKDARTFLGYFVWKITILRQKSYFFQLRRETQKFWGYFVWKNHDFTPKNHIFSNCGGKRENFWGISREKITILRQKILFFSNFRGARAGSAPLDPPLNSTPHLKSPSIRTPSLLKKSLSISKYLYPFKRVSTSIRRNLLIKMTETSPQIYASYNITWFQHIRTQV